MQTLQTATPINFAFLLALKANFRDLIFRKTEMIMRVPAQTAPWLLQEEMWDPEAVLGSFITAITARCWFLCWPKTHGINMKVFHTWGRLRSRFLPTARPNVWLFSPKAQCFFNQILTHNYKRASDTSINSFNTALRHSGLVMHLPSENTVIYPLEDSHYMHSSKTKSKILLSCILAEQKQKNYNNISAKTEL